MSGAGGSYHPNFHYFNDTRDGNWGVYIPRSDWNEHRGVNQQATAAQREEWIRAKQRERQELLAAENQRRAESLGVKERSIAARAILTQLSLNDIDRQDLIKRGFTNQQIRDIGFKSVEKWQRLTAPVNSRFPGVNITGRNLNNAIAGILIPVYTVTGEIVSFQIRNRAKGDGGRYRWLSSARERGRTNPPPLSLPNGENPLTFCYPQLLGIAPVRNSIGLAEGTGAKPNLAAIKMGQQVIGAAGGLWLSSPELLQDGLKRWRAQDIDLYLDGEDLQKPQVLQRWLKLYRQLTTWGYRPHLMWSGHDIDELAARAPEVSDRIKRDKTEDLERLRELKIEDLEYLCGYRVPPTTPLSLSRRLYYQSRQFTATEIQCRRFFEWEIPQSGLKNFLIAIKSALGTGKTEFLKKLEEYAAYRGLELIFIGYRNNLLRQTCDRIPDLYHIGDEDKVFLYSDYHKAVCHHSAGLLDPADMGNKIVILDECVSSLRDMLTSKLTAGRRKDGTDSRQVRLAHIAELIKNSHGVVVLDAYLSDTEVNFLQQLRPFQGVKKILNTYRNRMNVRMVNDKSTLTRSILDDALLGSNLLVTATTQKHCENLEKALIRIGISPDAICRIDGTTDRDESIQLFFRNPRAYLEQYRPQIVILSPTAESGISIDYPSYFQTHYHFHLGNLGVLSGLQFLLRYRDLTSPRVIYCEATGHIGDGNYSCFTKGVKDEFDFQVQQQMDLVFGLMMNGLTTEASELLKSLTQGDNYWLSLAHQYKANLNEEMWHLRELFIAAMMEDGYIVTVDGEDIDGCDDTEELMGRVELERRVIQSQRLYQARDITRLEYEAIKNNPTAGEAERLLASKYYLTQQQLPGISSTPSYSAELIQMVKYNYPGLIKQLETYHYLLHPELAEVNHLAAWLPVAETGSVWLPDQLNRSNLPMVKVGRELGLQDLIGKICSLKQITAIIEMVAASQCYQSSLKVKINPARPSDPIKLFRRISKKFGLKLVKHGDDRFQVVAISDSILAFKGAPKYELLTRKLMKRIAKLSGREFEQQEREIQALGKAMEDLGITDGRGRMRLVAGAARYLGLSVVSRRHRTMRGDKKVVTRIYTFSTTREPMLGALAWSGNPTAAANCGEVSSPYKFDKTAHPLSQGIKNTPTVYPGSQPVHVQHIYECVTRRLEQLATHQRARVSEWQNGYNPQPVNFSQAIHIEDFASINYIDLPSHLCGSPEFGLKNLRSVAQRLLEIGQKDEREFKVILDGYLEVVNPEVIQVALDMVGSKYPQVFERLKVARRA
jgi:hypothetical protein